MLLIIMKYMPTLNPERKIGGHIDFAHALEYAKKYTTQSSGGAGGGRVATTLIAFKLASRTGNLVFGFGPGSLTKSIVRGGWRVDRRLLPLYESYGKTGLVFFLIEYGLLGVLAIIVVCWIFARRCWHWYNIEKDSYWKAFSMGSLVFTVYETFIFLCYNTTTFLGDVLTPVYFYAMAVMYLRVKEITKANEMINTANYAYR